MYPFETSHSARLSDFAKLAELPNREELYRPENWRQYRILRRKSLRSQRLVAFSRSAANFSQPADSRASADTTQRA
jgi:hypothetical protein